MTNAGFNTGNIKVSYKVDGETALVNREDTISNNYIEKLKTLINVAKTRAVWMSVLDEKEGIPQDKLAEMQLDQDDKEKLLQLIKESLPLILIDVIKSPNIKGSDMDAITRIRQTAKNYF